MNSKTSFIIIIIIIIFICSDKTTHDAQQRANDKTVTWTEQQGGRNHTAALEIWIDKEEKTMHERIGAKQQSKPSRNSGGQFNLLLPSYHVLSSL